jgi:nicotinate-nucleotide adenylyltransferase
VLLPAGQPWQKADVTPAVHRLAMTELAAGTLNFPATRVSVARDEIEHDGPTYTVQTLTDWRAHEAAAGLAPASLALIVGADQLMRLDTWNGWQQLFDHAHVCVATRPGFDPTQVPPAVGVELSRRLRAPDWIASHRNGGMLIDSVLAMDVSATEIRQHLHERLAGSHDTCQHVPAAVWRYIRDHHLYRT